MKILFLGLNYSPEMVGIGHYSGDMLPDFVQRGAVVHAVVAKPYFPEWKTPAIYRGLNWQMQTEEGVHIIRCPIYVPGKPTGRKRAIHHLSFFVTALIPMLFRTVRNRPKLVFTVAPSIIAAPLALLCAKLSGAKTWLHVQDFEMEAAFATGLITERSFVSRLVISFERWVLRSFDQVSSISPNMCERLLAKGVDPARVYELRNWADVEHVRPIKNPKPFQASLGITTPYVALYAGSIGRKQGMEIIVAAARALRHRSDLTFVICGEGPFLDDLKRDAAGLQNIHFLPPQPRQALGDLLSIATVHLLPQIAGAADLVMPSKLTNMLASGRPVVATAEAGSSLANEIMNCGLATPPGDWAAFARAIESLIDDPTKCDEFGREARARAELRWSKRMILSNLAKHLEQKFGVTLKYSDERQPKARLRDAAVSADLG